MAEFTLGAIHEAIAEVLPDQPCIVHRARRLSYAEVAGRTRRLASYLAQQGLGLHTERAQLAGHQSGQDHIGLYLYNGPEYLESMLGAFKARCVPINVNYRYVEEELLYLLNDAAVRGLIYHGCFAPVVAAVRARVPGLSVLIQVDDGSGAELLPGAIEYEAALAQRRDERRDGQWSPDDLYILYTGGTTGMPKGVLWRQADIFVAALGGRAASGKTLESLQAVQDRARQRNGLRMLPAPPMMHGAAHWSSFIAWHSGGTVIIQDDTRRYDPADVLRTAARERANALLLVGDAFGLPLIEELERGDYALPELKLLTNSGAPMSSRIKRRLLELLPQCALLDAIGSSESGQQGMHVSQSGNISSGTFAPARGSCVLSEDLTRVLSPGDEEIGWFAQRGRVPLGYLGDPEKTRRTFPVLNKTRYSVPGDRARLTAEGQVVVLGRDSVTINSGGEKIFAEEVEDALKRHPDVQDAVVCGRDSERWGQEVCAVVQPRPGATVTDSALRDECAKHLARYKLPKAIIFRDRIERSPSGKADYRWARAQFAAER